MIATLRPGATFAGYRVESMIGRGGMGVVYHATDLALQRPVALKLIAPEHAQDPRFRERFLREPRLAASLDHANVVPIYQAGEHDGQLYLAMRFVEGSDLGSFIQRHGKLPPERSLAVLSQVAGALDAAHRKGLVHRDVKPANVLLDEEEHAYLTDFGITKRVSGDSTDTARVVGTLDYLAPEQIRGEEIDGRADVYALGCVLYECLSGAPPFRRPTEAETLWAHMQEKPAPLEGIGRLAPVLGKALAKERDERYSRCGELTAAARRALDDSDGVARRGPAIEERKLVTVLHAELGVHPELEGNPDRLRDLLERVRAVVSDEVEAFGGAISAGIGEAVLATFGSPIAQEDHAERALHAALGVRSALERQFGKTLSVALGVESGSVIAGATQPMVTGKPVVDAGRLARRASAGEVLLGERVATTARGGFEIREVEGTYRLVRALALRRPRARKLGSAFVARESELALLEAAFAEVAGRRQAQLATIVGDPGIGKSSLVIALRQRLAAGDAHWYSGRCLAYGRAITYRPLAEILEERLGVLPGDPQEVVRERLAGRPILGLTLGLDLTAGLHPREARERLHDAWIDLLDEICSGGPAIVVVEDLHWADPALLELLARAAREVRGPLLLLTTARPELLERHPDWGARGTRVSRLSLEPLSETEATQMLSALAGELPVAVRDLVLQRAEGNPFFVEEMLGSLLDRGVIRHEGGRWTASRVPPTVEVADSVQAVIGARIDLLPPAAKGALQVAAVMGRSFWEGAVRALAGSPEPDLRLLEERDFVRRSTQSSLEADSEYQFKHALTREVAYASLPAGRRARAHADFADWLERAGGGADQHAAQLAHHYAQAVKTEDADLAWTGDPDRVATLRAQAVRWLRRAAELALGRYELVDAAALYREAVSLEPDAAVRSELWAGSARASQLRFDMDGFREAMEHAVRERPSRPVAARLYARLSREGSRPYLWKHPPPREVVEGWVEHALELAEPGSAERAAGVAAWAELDPLNRAEAAREAVELAERHGDAELLADAYEARVKLAVAEGRLAEAGQWADRKMALVPRIADPDLRSGQCVIAALVYLRQGRIADGWRAVELHDRITTGLTPHHQVHAAAFLLLAATIGGDWAYASALSARAEAASAANADTPCQFNWRAPLMAALACGQLGDDREARRLEELAAESLSMHGPLAKEPALLRLALLRGDLEEVERLLGVNPDIDFVDVDYPAARLDALAALGHRPGVEAAARRALEIGGYVEPFAMRALGTVRADPSLMDRAATRFDQLGLTWRADETRMALTRLPPRSPG
jgi:class 3 adenylate cyclase/tetratricopeptide (TPR) repeat protein